MINETIYKKLIRLIPDLETFRSYKKLKAPGFMDLGVDILKREEDYFLIALSHYYEHPSGDLIPDPDMEIRVSPFLKMAEAMTYQDSFGFRQVYHDFDEATGKYRRLDPRAQKDLNSFLNSWLGNLLSQGHKPD